MSWLTTALPSLATALANLTPSQLQLLNKGVTQAVESQELQLLSEIEDDPANGSGAVNVLTGLSGVPASAVSWASSAVKAFKNGDKSGCASDLAQAKAVILAQHINSVGGLLG